MKAGGRILIVEDSRRQAVRLQLLLEQHGFSSEAEEGIRALRSGLQDLRLAPGRPAGGPPLSSLHMQAHSLKGAAQSVGRADIHLLCQALEMLLKKWKRGEAAPSAPALTAIEQALDLLEELLAGRPADAPKREAQMAEELGRF